MRCGIGKGRAVRQRKYAAQRGQVVKSGSSRMWGEGKLEEDHSINHLINQTPAWELSGW